MGAELITVSCDTHFSHLAWHTVEKELKDVQFKMGSDKTADLAKQFGIYLEDAGLALRGTYVIAPDGKLLFSEVNFLNVGRNVDELMRIVRFDIAENQGRIVGPRGAAQRGRVRHQEEVAVARLPVCECKPFDRFHLDVDGQ